jgi:hypothetical protein
MCFDGVVVILRLFVEKLGRDIEINFGKVAQKSIIL